MFQTYWLWPILLLDYLGQNGGFSNRGYLWSQNRRINCSGSEWRCIVCACLRVLRRLCLYVYCSEYIINNTLSSYLSLSGRLLNSLSAGIRIHFQDTLLKTFINSSNVDLFTSDFLLCWVSAVLWPGWLSVPGQIEIGALKLGWLQ